MKFFGKRMVSLCICCAFLTGCGTSDVVDQAVSVVQPEDEHILRVKNMALNNGPYKTIGEAFGDYFGSPTWKYYKGTRDGLDEDGDGKPDYTEENIDIVEFTGYCMYKDVKVKALIQFTPNDDDEFMPSFLSFNEVPQSDIIFSIFLADVFGADWDDLLSPESDDTSENTEEAVEPVDADDEYLIPDSDTVKLTDSYLRTLNLSQEELRIARNEIYARHGRKFNDSALQAHFDSCSWYNGTIAPDSFDESILNDIEKFNVQAISDFENAKTDSTIPKDWYTTYNEFYNANNDVSLEIAWLDDGTLEIILDGLTMYYANADDYSNDNGGLKYICDDGTVFHYYPNHRHEISLEPIDGDLYKGVYYPV